jgi:hypothetical protein
MFKNMLSFKVKSLLNDKSKWVKHVNDVSSKDDFKLF